MPRKTIFISCSHDSDEHRQEVLALSERLRRDGFDTRLDQYVNGSPAEGWPRWMLDQLEEADAVLVVCTSTYYRLFHGHEESEKGKGVDWEGALITQELYGTRGKALKLVPVMLENGLSAFIPEPLRGKTPYTLTSEKSYRDLYGFLLSGVEPQSHTPTPIPDHAHRKAGSPQSSHPPSKPLTAIWKEKIEFLSAEEIAVADA